MLLGAPLVLLESPARMSTPLVFDIPHTLGREEARRRIEAGLPKLERHIPGGGTVDAAWPEPDRLELTIAAMGQKVGVTMAIADEVIHASVAVPFMLSMMAGPIGEFVRASADKMLAAPKS